MTVPTWRRAATIGVAAALVALIGLALPAETYLTLVAFLFLVLAVGIAFVVQLQLPILGILLLVLMGVAFPVEFQGPAAGMVSAPLPLGAFLVLAWLTRALLDRSKAGLDGGRVVFAALFFISVTAAAFAAGQFPWYNSGGAPIAVQVVECTIFVVSVCLLLAVGHQITGIEQLKVLSWTFLATGLLVCVLQIVPIGFLARFVRPRSVGSLFWTWLVALSLAQALLNRTLPWSARLLLLVIPALAFYRGLFEARSWASGWLPPLVAAGAILTVRIPRLSIGLALLVIPLGVLLGGPISDALLGDEQYSLSTRQEAWRALWPLVAQSPVIGTGPANYYYFTENTPILGWYVRFISHNNYQDLLVQTGFLGLLAFAWLAVELLWVTVRVYRAGTDGFSRAYAAGVFGGVVGSLFAGMLGDWIIPFYYNAGILGFRSSLLFWVFLGGILALKRISARQEAAAIDHQPLWRTPRSAVAPVSSPLVFIR